MTRVTFGLVCGIAYGLLSVATMIPLQFSDKRAAMLGALLNRFAIGFLIPLVSLPMPGWAKGLMIGLLLSLPDAIITKTYVPIIGFGALGGLVIGVVSARYASTGV